MTSFPAYIARARTALLTLLVAVAMTVGTGKVMAQQDVTASPDAGNPMCPVMPDERIDPEQWVEHQGKRVYFCCPMCKRKFSRSPETYLGALPQFADAQDDDPTHGELAAHGHDHGDHSHDEQNVPGSEPASPMTHVSEESGHDHADHEHGEASSAFGKLIGWLGKFHPPATDFPVALLISAAIAEMLLIVTGRSLFDAAAQFAVWLGSLSAVAAVALGWFYAGFRLSDPDWIMTVHRWLGTAVGVWVILLLALCVAAHRASEGKPRRRLAYRATLFISAAAVSANGFFGGALVYGLDHYAW